MDEEKLAKEIVKEQGRVKQVEVEKRRTDERRFLKGCLGFVVGVPIAVTMCVMAISCGDGGDYVDPNDEPANVAAKEDLKQSFSWVKDLYVSPGHMNIGVVPGEKEWGAPMITLAVCSTLKSHRSTVRRVRFVDVYKTSAGKSPRQAEIVVVTCPDIEPLGARVTGGQEVPEKLRTTTAPDPGLEALRTRISGMAEFHALGPLGENLERVAEQQLEARDALFVAVDEFMKATEPDSPLWALPNPEAELERINENRVKLLEQNDSLKDVFIAAREALNRAEARAVEACMANESASEKQCSDAMDVLPPSLVLQMSGVEQP